MGVVVSVAVVVWVVQYFGVDGGSGTCNGGGSSWKFLLMDGFGRSLRSVKNYL